MAGPERALRELADAWIEAFNARDLDAVLELAADDVEVVTLHRGTLTRDDFPGDVAGSGDGAASFRGGDGRISRVKLHQSLEAALASDP